MPRTKHLWLSVTSAISILAVAVTTGCGSTPNPDDTRYFGDHPGQEATKAAISRADCRALRRAVQTQAHARARAESEPSPPASHCLISGLELHVSVYLDASTAARQRYFNRMTEQVQFYGTDPAKSPHAVAGVGDRGAYNQSASWIPAFSTLYAVRGNRWLTVSYAVAGVPKAAREQRAAALGRLAFRLTAS